MQAVNGTGQRNGLKAVDVSMQLTVATTLNATTSFYVFLGGGSAIEALNTHLNRTGTLSCWSALYSALPAKHSQSTAQHLLYCIPV